MTSTQPRVSQMLEPRINFLRQLDSKFISRLALWIFLLAVALISICASAQDKPFPAAASVLQPQAYVSLQPVPRGHAFQVAVVAKISPGFHINAHVPSEDYLIPTKIMADLSPGVFLVATTDLRVVMRA